MEIMETNGNGVQSLEGFNFDSPVSFFDQPVDTTNMAVEGGIDPNDLEEDEKPTKIDEDKDKGKEKEEQEIEDTKFFEDESNSSEEDNEESSEEIEDKTKERSHNKNNNSDSGDDDSKYYTSLAKEMKDKGYLSLVDIDENAELSEEEFVDLYNTQKEKEIEEYFEGFFEEMDEDAKAFLQFKKAGGSTADFFKTYQDNGFDLEKYNSEDEKSREKLLRYYISNIEGKDEDEVEDTINWLKEGGKDKSYADKYAEKLKKVQENNKTNLIKQAEEATEAKKETAKQFNEDLNKVLLSTEKVKEFSFTKQDQKDLMSYITKPTVKIGKNYITPFQQDLGAVFGGKTPEDKQKLLLLAKLIKSDFDTKDIVKEVKKEVVKTTRNKIKEARQNVNARGSSTFGGKKSLADFIDK